MSRMARTDPNYESLHQMGFIGRALDYSGLSPVQKTIYCKINDADHSTWAYGQVALAKVTGVAIRTLRRQLKLMRDLHVIRIVKGKTRTDNAKYVASASWAKALHAWIAEAKPSLSDPPTKRYFLNKAKTQLKTSDKLTISADGYYEIPTVEIIEDPAKKGAYSAWC